jgi:hypothetical protein
LLATAPLCSTRVLLARETRRCQNADRLQRQRQAPLMAAQALEPGPMQPQEMQHKALARMEALALPYRGTNNEGLQTMLCKRQLKLS